MVKTMNVDNERLKDIQVFKAAYYKELEKADTISDCLMLEHKINELEAEELEILKRFDVIV